MRVNIIVVIALMMNLQCNLCADGTGRGDNLPGDVLTGVLKYATGDAPGQVNRRWRNASQEQNAQYLQKFDKLVPLLQTMARYGKLYDNETRELITLYRQLIDGYLVNDRFVGLLSRVPHIIKDAIQPEYRAWRSVSPLIDRFYPYLLLMGCPTNVGNMLKRYITYDRKLDWYLIQYHFAFDIGAARHGLFWNTVSVYEPISGRTALDWYAEGLEWFSIWGDDQQFYYLRTVWCSADRILDVGEFLSFRMRHEFVEQTQKVFVETVSHYVQHKKFKEIEAFLTQLKQRGRLVLLQQTRRAVPLIPFRHAEQLYTRAEWKDILSSFSPLLQEFDLGDDYATFVERTYVWQTSADVPVNEVTREDREANNLNWKINSILKQYQLYKTQPHAVYMFPVYQTQPRDLSSRRLLRLPMGGAVETDVPEMPTAWPWER